MEKNNVAGKISLSSIYIYYAAFVTGLVVLAVEIIGTRVVAPYYGTTIYVWASQIGVALLSLSAGYFAGGIISEKKPDLRMMAAIMAVSGAMLFIVPNAATLILKATNPLGPRFGALAASFLLFSVPLGIMGMISPFAIRLSAASGTIGVTAGRVYAVSTIGSFAGAILAGFYLLPNIGLTAVFYACGFLMVISGLMALITGKGRVAAAVVTVVLLAAWDALPVPAPEILKSRNNTLLYEKQTHYGRLRVFDHNMRYRYMMMDGAVQMFSDLRDSSYAPEYIFGFMEGVKLLNKPGSALVIGLGGGAADSLLTKSGIETFNVDIDPDVVKAAKDFYGFSGKYTIADGRNYIKNMKEKYDIIFLDTFNGYSVYPYLLSREAFEDAVNGLNDGGMLCLNVVGRSLYGDGGVKMYDKLIVSVYRTLKQVFPNVAVKASDDELTNFIFFASKQAFDPGVLRSTVFLPENEGLIQTDDYNPADFLTHGIIELWRKLNTDYLGEEALL